MQGATLSLADQTGVHSLAVSPLASVWDAVKELVIKRDIVDSKKWERGPRTI